MVSLTTFVAFVFFLFSSCHVSSARPSKLNKPVVILISADGFRFGYQFKTPTPNIGRLIANGTEAATGLIPVFPTLTFPNHYSIATGLYPPYHGIIMNRFTDPSTGRNFSTRSREPEWWLGEPLWQTVVKHGMKASTYFWPGGDVVKGSWTCPAKFCPAYNSSTPFADRVDTLLSYFDLPRKETPSFMALYLEDPDSTGHRVGPDDPELTAAVANIDRVIGRLIQGLEARGVFDEVTIILVGDHGLVGTCDGKVISLADLAPWINIPAEWITQYSPVLTIRPSVASGVTPAEVVAKMNEGLGSGQVRNGMKLRMYLKEDLPERLHYSASERIPPVVGMLDEGYRVEQRALNRQDCSGDHGYDNAFFSMRTIFIGHGPQFAKGRKVPSFENVQIYNTITSILKIKGAANNGTASFPRSILLPRPFADQ